MRVFLSYAHTPADAALADYLALRLTASGIDVWWDRASLHAAEPTRTAIEQAAASCDHAIFIVSKSWLDREWTEWELDLFASRDPALVRRVPILRRSRRDLRPPPALVKFAALEWLEHEPDVDARFWQVHCALHGQPPGDPGAWAARGRALSGRASATVPTSVSEPREPRQIRPSLRCDRAPQWKTVDDLTGSGAHEVIVVPGEAGQDHEHFVQRVQHLLRADPPRSIARVAWPVRPAGRDEYAERLAQALGVSTARLVPELHDRLAGHNLVLLHPCLRARFVDDSVVRYYTEWLPGWLDAADPRMQVKCVQPVEWPAEPFWAPVARLLPGRADGDGDKRSALTFVERLLQTAAPLLRFIRLADLHDVATADLEEFCQVTALSATQKAFLVARVEARRPRTSEDLFQAIDDFLPDARGL